LHAVPLTKEGFAPYGDVIEMEGAKHYAINSGSVERYHDLANIHADHADGGRAIVSLAKINIAGSFPFKFNLVERHPRGSQAFIPMFEAPVVVVVAKPAETINPADLKAFVTNGMQGFNYHPGTWHMPLMSDQVGRMFVVIDRAGHGCNCDEFSFENATIEVTLPVGLSA
jgi:ureidoglycolate lyase